MPYSMLPQRRLLRLLGDDTIPFLQGLLTNDISRLEEGQCCYAALLSPQGKFLYDMFVIAWQGAVWLDVDASRAEDLQKRLMMYRLRSQVNIEMVNDMQVAALWDQEPVASDTYCLVADPRLEALGWRMIGGVATDHDVGLDAYEAMRLSYGVPDGAKDMIVDKSLLLEFGFEALHGVDFNKGCYVGQEVTARSKHRAQLRKALYIVDTEFGHLPEMGMPIMSGESILGEMRSSYQQRGVALLRIGPLEQAMASQQPVTAGDVTITARHPDWWPQP